MRFCQSLSRDVLFRALRLFSHNGFMLHGLHTFLIRASNIGAEAAAFRVRKLFGTFEKRAPELWEPEAVFAGSLSSVVLTFKGCPF